MWVVTAVVLGLVAWGAYALATSSTRRSRSGCDPDPERREPRTTPAREDPVVTLRERYARGEIDEAELDRRLDGLLRTEPGHAGGQLSTTAEPASEPAAAEPANEPADEPPAPPAAGAGAVRRAGSPGRS
jgi:hypothetical protein